MIWTTEFWCRKRQLYQLSHDNCLAYPNLTLLSEAATFSTIKLGLPLDPHNSRYFTLRLAETSCLVDQLPSRQVNLPRPAPLSQPRCALEKKFKMNSGPINSDFVSLRFCDFGWNLSQTRINWNEFQICSFHLKPQLIKTKDALATWSWNHLISHGVYRWWWSIY